MSQINEVIIQILGVAYSYQPSLAFRKKKTAGLTAHHSSQHQDFSYFFKGFSDTVVCAGENLLMIQDPQTGATANHWPEPELAILLGHDHQIVAYSLANDFTAHSIELRGRTAEFDGTFFGKCWPGSCAIGPRWFAPEEIGDDSRLDIGLKIVRAGQLIYDHAYNTARRRYPFCDIPPMIVKYASEFAENPPPSKRVLLNNSGLLPSGTVILLGTGIIVKEQYYSQPGDELTIYSPKFGELTNKVVSL
ncbi:MAG: fumarylacetoacetate hydrolase family protein [bacterium]|nr:fumarylacetoacetate hydrolase family protein [bacterium]